jgi:ATP-dependent Clp protease adaptor protein ClpS
LLTTSGQTISPPQTTRPQTTRPGISSPQIDQSEEVAKTPLYRVVLLDDDDHTYDYVIEMLQKIFIFTAEQALRHAQEVDAMGRTVLITCELAEAEFARDQVQSYGRDWRLPRSHGSMSAIVEPAGDSA